MIKEKFLPENKIILDEIFLNFTEVKPGKMFGYPGYFVNGKLAACHFHEGVALKVPEELYKKLIDSKKIKAEPFRPLNKNMGKNWILIYRENPEDFQQDFDIFGAAVQFVLSITKL